MTPADPPQILSPGDGPPVAVRNPDGRAPICLVCEHASSAIPAALGDLGLAKDDRFSHAAWDIGAGDLALELARALDAPLVTGRVSRLVYDCNRPPQAPDAIPARSEVVEVPGNYALTGADRAARVNEIYVPFRATLASVLDGFAAPPALVTIHSFSPVWHGKPRSVALGLLHDADDRLAVKMLGRADGTLRTELNAPYAVSDGVTHTLREHAVPRQLDNVMIEVRNDLLRDAAGVARVAGVLLPMLRGALRLGADPA